MFAINSTVLLRLGTKSLKGDLLQNSCPVCSSKERLVRSIADIVKAKERKILNNLGERDSSLTSEFQNASSENDHSRTQTIGMS